MINVKQTKRELLRFFQYRNINKVLDLGCGKGLMSLFFLKGGIETIGIDKRDVIDERLKQNKHFKFILGNIVSEDFGNRNDLIIASLIVQVFRKDNVHKLFEKMQEATSENGYNFLICMSDKDECNQSDYFFPTKEELLKYYGGWKVEKELQSKTELEEHSTLPPHNHNLIFLILRKVTK